MNRIIAYILKFLKIFKSVKFSAVIIALMILFYFLGLVLPQKWMFLSEPHYTQWKEKNILNTLMDLLELTDIYVSPVTFTLLALFFINLIVVTINRVPVMMKRAYLTKDRPSFDAGSVKKKGQEIRSGEPAEEQCIERTAAFFKERHWKIIPGSVEKTFLAVKNRYAPIGFLLFHFSFILCLIGGLLISYTRFSGEMALTEGQEFRGQMSFFHTIIDDAKIMKELPFFTLDLVKVEPYYENDIPTELLVYMDVGYKGKVRNEIIKVNEPVRRGPLTMISENIGVSPLFVVRNNAGQELDGAYVSLKVLHGEEDSFSFEAIENYEFRVKFYPDHIVENGEERTRSIELKNPAVNITILKDEQLINKGTIRQGEYIELGPDMKIGFKEIRYWVEMLIIREYGMGPLIAGFLLMAMGLIMRLVFYQKRVRVAFEYADNQTIIYIDGTTEQFKHSFREEIEKMGSEVKEHLNSFSEEESVKNG